MNHLARALLSHERIAVITHVSPDGDTLGSALAIRRALLSLGKRAIVVCQDKMPEMYRFMPDADGVLLPDAVPFAPDCAMFVDVAAPERAGTALALALSAPCQLLLDHHETNVGFVPDFVVDGGASSVGELAVELIDTLGVPLDAQMATQIFIAIATDTGNFGFSCTTPAAMRTVARCLEAGLEIDEISRRLFRLRTVPRTRLIGTGLSAMERHHDGQIAITKLTREMLANCGALPEDTEGLINYLNEMEGVEACCLAVERENGTKCSLRSSGKVDVGAVAFAFGGGGHKVAAGVTIALPIDEAADKLLDALRQTIGAR